MSIGQINERNLTPMMRHWFSIKKKYTEHLIAYRMGDFYEFFYDDAVRVSKLLGITLTNRKIGNDKYPLAGIPHHACKNYFTNLIKKKETVIIVEQLEDPTTVKGRIVKRGVTRILSPGTITEEYMLKSNENNYIASLVKHKKGYGCAFADISTGEFVVAEYSIKKKDPFERLLSIFARFSPAELIIPSELKKDENLFIFLTDITEAIVRTYDDYYFEYNEAYNLIKQHFKISNLKVFGLEDLSMSTEAAGGLLAFLKETQRDLIPNIFKINLLKEKGILHLDYTTQRNLELIDSLWEKGKETSLISIFDRTLTPMGARLIKKVILQPLTDLNEINHRLNIVESFKDDIFLRTDLRERLSVLGDLERYINRLTYINRTNARDLINIKNSLEKIPKIKNLLEKSKIQEISEYLDKINEFKNIQELIGKTIKDDPPVTIKEGNIIKQGYNSKIDDLRDLLNNGKKYLLNYEEREKKNLNLNSGFKVGYNNILGYYVQITKRTLELIKNIPENYIERQTLKNAKRYTTQELKMLEEKIISAQEKINDLEYKIFCTIRDKVVEETLNIIETASNIAYIDVFSSFAEISEKYNYCRPILTNNKKIEIKDGRHPVIEQMNVNESFISNDCYIDTNSEQILIITGPNMAGKCVTPETLIFSGEGILPIKTFKPEKIIEGSFKEKKIKIIGLNSPAYTSHFYSDGIKPTIRVKTKRGYTIEGTKNHPILVRDKHGKEKFKTLKEINLEDYIVINRKNDLWGSEVEINYKNPLPSKKIKKNSIPEKITEDLAYLLGLLVGDGIVIYENSYILSNYDEFIRDEFIRINKELFNYDLDIKSKNKDIFITSKYLRNFLKFLGLEYKQAHEKEVPICILKAPKRIIIGFLQGLFDTNGTAGKRYGNATYSTSSIKLARQVHIILLNFGIVSSLKIKKTKKRPCYEIRITGFDSIKFHKDIGFRLPRKKNRKKIVLDLRMTDIDIIPYLSTNLDEIKKKYLERSHLIPREDKLKYNKKISGIFDSYIRQGRNISFFKFEELIDYCHKCKIDCSKLEMILNKNYFYDKIEIIEKSNSIVYDFTVPEGHAFIGNGIINHNSTFLRQVALICLIAQMGCFVPASLAKIGIIDQIFTRIGASDDLARKLSTFMIEMTETAKILNYATENSLVIIDELGRGTSTSDGQSIAIATLEKLHDMGIKTLFSTHYHQLTEINLPRVRNYHLDIIENEDGSINFIRKLKEGSTDKSYGIHIAKLAGIPEDVIIEAFKILEQIENEDPLGSKIQTNNPKQNGIEKYHNKLIDNKNKQLENLNNEIETKRKELQNLNVKLEEMNSKVKKNIIKNKVDVKTTLQSKKKQTVQTSFFKPIVKTDLIDNKNLNNVLKIINSLDIDELTPVDAMKKLIELKEKIE